MNYSKRHQNPGLTSPPPVSDPAMQQWMEQTTEMLRQATGQVGSKGLSFITYESLEEIGVIKQETGTGGSTQPGGGNSGEGDYVPDDPPVDNSPPPAPRNVTTSGSPTTIRIIWDNPVLNYSYRAEVYVNIDDNLGTATLAGSSNGWIYQHTMGEDTRVHYFWVRFVRGNGEEIITGPYNATQGTPGQVGGELVDAQLGQLDVDKLIGGTADFVEANILDGSITNAKIGDTIQSDNYQPGVQGWIIKK